MSRRQIAERPVLRCPAGAGVVEPVEAPRVVLDLLLHLGEDGGEFVGRVDGVEPGVAELLEHGRVHVAVAYGEDALVAAGGEHLGERRAAGRVLAVGEEDEEAALDVHVDLARPRLGEHEEILPAGEPGEEAGVERRARAAEGDPVDGGVERGGVAREVLEQRRRAVEDVEGELLVRREVVHDGAGGLLDLREVVPDARASCR